MAIATSITHNSGGKYLARGNQNFGDIYMYTSLLLYS